MSEIVRNFLHIVEKDGLYDIFYIEKKTDCVEVRTHKDYQQLDFNSAIDFGFKLQSSLSLNSRELDSSEGWEKIDLSLIPESVVNFANENQ